MSRITSSGGLALAFTLSVSLATSGDAAQSQNLHGHVPAAVARLGLPSINRLPGPARLNLAIGLPLRNREALTRFLQQLYDPASPLFHQYLTPAQFTEKYGPTEEDYLGLIAFAQAHRLTVTAKCWM